MKKLDGTDLQNKLGLSLSSTIGRTDATQDIEEAKRLAGLVDSDCDMDLVLKYIENAGASVARVGKTTTDTFKTMNDADPIGPNNLENDRGERIGAGFLEFIGFLGENPMI